MDTIFEEQLCKAARQGTIERVGALLDQGVAVDSRGAFQWTPLLHASGRGHRAVAALLLDREANVNAESTSGFTPATLASGGGHLDLLQLLVSRGADIHHRGQYGYSSLLCAALNDRLPVCEYLLSLGADLMAANNDNYTALTQYGLYAVSRLSLETKVLHRATLQKAWENGPHPSQVQRRRDERWFRRGPLLTVLAEHGYRPLQLRALAIAMAAAELDPAAPIQPVAIVTKQQRHAYLMERVFSCEGIVRLMAALL